MAATTKAAMYTARSRRAGQRTGASRRCNRRSAPAVTTAAANPLASLFGGNDGKRTVIITGASSGLGKQCARSLLEQGGHHVVMAVRDTAKMGRVASELGFDPKDYTIMELDLNSLANVRKFVKAFRSSGRTLDCLCCNAALYLPNQPKPSFTEEGFETSFGVNHLSHYLLARLLIPDLQKGSDPRCVIVGSITGNTNTVGGGAVLPFADLGEFQGLKSGGKDPVCMVDGKVFNGAKAYKDAKLCNMMTVLELHRRYHEQTGIAFTSMYPGCIAETGLFRQKRGWFRTLFPLFMKYVTGGYVSQEESGDRLAQCCSAAEASKSGVYWSWNGGARHVATYSFKEGNRVGAGGSGGDIFENLPSAEVRDEAKGRTLWELSERAVADFLDPVDRKKAQKQLSVL